MDKIAQILMQEFKLKEFQIVNTLKLIDEGNTIPFIARYRKEATGELSDEVLRDLSRRLEALRSLEAKKEEVIRLIDEQGNLTDEIRLSIENAKTVTEIDDIYRPFRPKRRTRAMIAKEKGLEDLATAIFAQDKTDAVEVLAEPFLDTEKGVESAEDAIAGAMDIIAEIISDNADFRKKIRALTLSNSAIKTKQAKDDDSVYSMYYDFSEPISKLANHRVLAINRGEKDGFLSVKLDIDGVDYDTLKAFLWKTNLSPVAVK